MRLETFRAADLTAAFAMARHALGEDAMITHSRIVREGLGTAHEVVAADASDIQQFRRLLNPEPPRLGARRAGTGGQRPFVVSLIGPTGAGKTTTVAKLAVSELTFVGREVGLISLDTYRAGAIEQLGGFADAAELRLEVVFEPSQISEAFKRLAGCDIVIVDTPGRGPKGQDGDWQRMLRQLGPDETHLVVPATTRLDLAPRLLESYKRVRPTHALLTKLDEVPNDAEIAHLAAALELPMRYVTDGQEVPADLHPAGPRVFPTLTVAPEFSATT
ncbi:hypothetical protein EBR44_00200 [bacterium]|jgi:flagellar biosynthesis protein FlhF|nr:hypothetical protein [bacterium]